LGIQVAGADRTDLTFYASSLKTVHAGDTVSVTLINGQKKDFVVRGIFKDDFVLADNAAFITQNALNNLIPTTKNKSTSIYVKTKNIGNEDSTISKLQSIRNDLKYDKWQSLQGVIKDQLDTFTLVNNILRMISLLVASVTIFIITYVDLVNKRKQIGIERAIGIKSTAIVLSYLLKAIYYSIAAVLLGSLLYLYLIVPIVIAHPFHFPNGLVTLAIDSNMMINDGISIVIVGMISALIPSISTIRMKILDAIWGN
jgi:putative ABC transport system permease protein